MSTEWLLWMQWPADLYLKITNISYTMGHVCRIRKAPLTANFRKLLVDR